MPRASTFSASPLFSVHIQTRFDSVNELVRLAFRSTTRLIAASPAARRQGTIAAHHGCVASRASCARVLCRGSQSNDARPSQRPPPAAQGSVSTLAPTAQKRPRSDSETRGGEASGRASSSAPRHKQAAATAHDPNRTVTFEHAAGARPRSKARTHRAKPAADAAQARMDAPVGGEDLQAVMAAVHASRIAEDALASELASEPTPADGAPDAGGGTVQDRRSTTAGQPLRAAPATKGGKLKAVTSEAVAPAAAGLVQGQLAGKQAHRKTPKTGRSDVFGPAGATTFAELGLDEVRPSPACGGCVAAGLRTHVACEPKLHRCFERMPALNLSRGVLQALCKHLAAHGFAKPTAVQKEGVPALLRGRDVMMRAPTGTGKTLAYLAPVVHALGTQAPRVSRGEGCHALVITPTRELTLQARTALSAITLVLKHACVHAEGCRVHVCWRRPQWLARAQVYDVATLLAKRYIWLVPGLLVGGENRHHEKRRLRKGVTVLVATPGRLLDHLAATEAFVTSSLAWLILDEADRLLDMGFEQTVSAIVGKLDERADPTSRCAPTFC